MTDLAQSAVTDQQPMDGISGLKETPLAPENASPINQIRPPSLQECTNVPKRVLTSSETHFITDFSNGHNEPDTLGPSSCNANHFDAVQMRPRKTQMLLPTHALQ
jgi:hypothetical protein